MTASLSRDAGGLFQSVRGLAQASITLNHGVFVLGVQDKHTEADIQSWKPISTQAFPTVGPERFSFAPGIHKALQKRAPDILQLHGLWRYPSIVAFRWHRETNRPYIVHPHGMLDPWAVKNSHWKKVIAGMCYENRMLQKANCLRALCQSEAESIRKYGLRNPICILPNGMTAVEDEGHPCGGALKELKAKGQKVLLYLGRIHPKKGLSNLLKAWAGVNRQPNTHHGSGKPDWILAIAGWDERGHEAELKRQASELGILTSVVFLGPQFGDAKSACYRHCDAFILPSFSEGLPMVILEAWAHGKPVLMTPECNLPVGFTAHAAIQLTTEVEGIARGLMELFGLGAGELSQMGTQGLRTVKEKFNWQKIAEELHQVCEWLVRKASKPGCVYVD